MAIKIGCPAELEARSRMSAPEPRRHPGRGEDQDKDHCERATRRFPQVTTCLRMRRKQIAVGLEQRRTLPAQQPGLCLAREAQQQRRQDEHQRTSALPCTARSSIRSISTPPEAEADEGHEDEAQDIGGS